MDHSVNDDKQVNAGVDDGHPRGFKSAAITALEAQYISLLEKRIQSLEATVNASHLQQESGAVQHVDKAMISAATKDPTIKSQISNGVDNRDTSDLTKNDLTITNLQQHDAAPSNHKKTSSQDDKANANANAEDKGKERNPRVKYRESKPNENGIRQESDTTEDKFDAIEDNPRGDTAVEVLRRYGEKNQYQGTTLKFLDPRLNALTIFILAYHPWMRHIKHDSDLCFASPFEELVHSWDQIQDVISDDTERQINKDLRDKIREVSVRPQRQTCDAYRGLTLLDNESDLQTAIRDLKVVTSLVERTPELQTFFKSGRDTARNKYQIAWDLLWTVFPPGELVFAQTYMEHPQIFIVHVADSADKLESRKRNVWRLDCWAYDWNGTNFRRVWAEFEFPKFKDEDQITNLPCYPLKYHPKADEIREDLRKRGEKFCNFSSLKGSRVFSYTGSALSRGEGFKTKRRINSLEDPDAETIASRDMSRGNASDTLRITVDDSVIVDAKAFLEHGARVDGPAPMGDNVKIREARGGMVCRCDHCEENTRLQNGQRSYFDSVTDSTKFEPLQYMMLPPRVLGYILGRKRWVELDVKLLKDAKSPNADSLKRLKMPEKRKELIRDLIKYHANGNEQRPKMEDLNKQKGNGLVILFHGPPGVGKTSTAESIAEATGKPLLPIGVSDIGLQPAAVEQKFSILFELASVWKAILLFDEADVFLESRANNTADLQRNALVSVLLRSLEYFNGILILTTNRMRSLDIAVQSRINLSLRFPPLSDTDKKEIYKSFIRMIDDENPNKTQLLEWIDKEKNVEDPPFKKLNGRQIRNVLFSAATLAAGGDGAGHLELIHIHRIRREMVQFQSEVEFLLEETRKKAEVGYDRDNA